MAKKLIVQTPTDLSGARVKTVLMEMDRNAKVHNVVKKLYMCDDLISRDL